MSPEFTIVIPSKNRQRYFPRLDTFYRLYNCQIIIADASDLPYEGHFHSQIIYRHFPQTDFITKLMETISSIKTPFVLLGADDDFLFPDAVQHCVDFLKQDASYSSAQGLYVGFHTQSDSAPFAMYPGHWQYHIALDRPIDRLISYWTRYIQLYYAVHRTENFLRVLEIAQKLSISRTGLNFFEIVIGSTAIIRGKHKVLPVLYAAREADDNESAGKTHLKIWSIKDHPELSRYFETYITELSKELSKATGDLEGVCRQYVERALHVYLSHHQPVPKRLRTRISTFVKHRLRKMANYLGYEMSSAPVQFIDRICANNPDAKKNLSNLNKALSLRPNVAPA